MKQDRKPEYGKKDRRFRIVSRPNEYWAVQEHTGQDSTTRIDPWMDLMGASKLSYEQASSRLAQTQPT